MSEITVIGVGFSENDLTIGALEVLRVAKRIVLHTSRMALADYLDEIGAEYSSLDYLYDAHDDFDEHARAAADAVSLAAKADDVCYCVFDARDASAALLIERGAKVIAGVPSEGELFARAGGQTQLFAAADCVDLRPLDARRAALVREIDTRELAGEVKLRLSEVYPDDSLIYVLIDGHVIERELYELDRLEKYNHTLSTLVLPAGDGSGTHLLDDLVRFALQSVNVPAADFDGAVAIGRRFVEALAGGVARGEYTINEILSEISANFG